MLCRKCGNELKMGAKFCYSCGYYVDEEDYEENKKKKKEKDANKLSFKEKLAKRREEKRLAKEAKIRQKEIEEEEKEREKLAAEYEKERKIKDFYKKENENRLRAEKRAKELEDKIKVQEEAKQKSIDDKFDSKKKKYDDELKKKVNVSSVDDYEDENANFSYGTEDLITRSPGLGIEKSEASIHVKDENDLSFDDFNVENRYKKIEKEVKRVSASKNLELDISYDEYKNNDKKKKNSKDEFSKYVVVILSSVVAFAVIFFLVNFITNNMNQGNNEPEVPIVVDDITVLLSNCTVKIPGNLNYNVEGSSLYVAYDTHTLSFTVSKDNYDSYAADLTKLSKDFEKRNYTVSSSDKKVVNGQEFIVYKLIVSGSNKYFYLTRANSDNVAMGMIEMKGSDSIDTALQSVANIILTIKM